MISKFVVMISRFVVNANFVVMISKFVVMISRFVVNANFVVNTQFLLMISDSVVIFKRLCIDFQYLCTLQWVSLTMYVCIDHEFKLVVTGLSLVTMWSILP
jgi:hypothetical protein